MNDLIRRQDAIDAVHYYIESGYKCDIFQELKNLPSVESKQTAKVIIHKRYIGTNLNIVGTPNILCEHLCGACKKKVIDGDNYCSHCGARLEWNE